MYSRFVFIHKIIMLMGFLLAPGSAFSAGDFIIRGDQPTSIISEIPLDPKLPPAWLLDDSGRSADEQMKKLFADMELFTKPPENGESLIYENSPSSELTSKEVKSGVKP